MPDVKFTGSNKIALDKIDAYIMQRRREAEQRAARRVEVYLDAGTGTDGTSSAGDNIIKARTNKKQGRNAFHVPEDVQRFIADEVSRLLIRNPNSTPANTDAAYRFVGERIVKAFIANAARGAGPRGQPFKAVRDRYFQYKVERYGDTHPLKKTGAMLDGLKVRLKGNG